MGMQRGVLHQLSAMPQIGKISQQHPFQVCARLEGFVKRRAFTATQLGSVAQIS